MPRRWPRTGLAVLSSLVLTACGVPDTLPADDSISVTTKCYWQHTCFESVQTYDQRKIAVTLDYRGSFEPFTVLIKTEQSGMRGLYQLSHRLVLQEPRQMLLLDLYTVGSDPYSWRWTVEQHPGTEPADHDDTVIYRLPYKDGESYPVIQAYGGKYSHDSDNHYSIDWAMPIGTPVLAARGGVVVEALDGSDRKGRGADNHVLIRHDDGTYGWYLHFQKDGATIAHGDVVKAGDLIGYSGDTGYSREPHLHFQVSAIVEEEGRLYQSFPTRFLSADGIHNGLQVGDEPVAITP